MAKKEPKLKTFAAVVTKLLDDAGLTPYAVGKLVPISMQTVYDFANGKREPKAESLRLILKACGKPWAWLDEHYDSDSAA